MDAGISVQGVADALRRSEADGTISTLQANILRMRTGIVVQDGEQLQTSYGQLPPEVAADLATMEQRAIGGVIAAERVRSGSRGLQMLARTIAGVPHSSAAEARMRYGHGCKGGK